MEAGVCHGKATGLHGWASDPCAAFHLFGSRHDRRGPGGQSLCSACWHNCRSCHYAPATWCLAEQPRLMPVWGHPSFAVAYSAGHWSQGVQRHGLGQIGMETGSGGHLLVGARQRQRRWQDRHCCTGCTHLAEGKAGQLVAEWWAGAGLQAAAAAGAAPALCCMAHCTSPRHAAWQEGHMWHPSAACNSKTGTSRGKLILYTQGMKETQLPRWLHRTLTGLASAPLEETRLQGNKESIFINYLSRLSESKNHSLVLSGSPLL